MVKKQTSKTVLAKMPQAEVRQMAHKINAEYKAGVQAMKKGLVHFKNCGMELKWTREALNLQHGEWIKWVEANCDFDYESAKKYVRLAEHWKEINAAAKANRERITDLGINAALAYAVKKPAGKKTEDKKPTSTAAPQPSASSTLADTGEVDIDEEGNVVWVTPPTPTPTAAPPESPATIPLPTVAAPPPEPEGLTDGQRQIVADYVAEALVSAGLVNHVDGEVMNKAKKFLEALTVDEEELYERIVMLG